MKIILFGIVIFLMYEVIPDYYNRNLSRKVIKRFRSNNEIALTFDDGPDSRYTPKLLDLLKEHGVKASFFVVAENAVENQDIFFRMIEEGHSVGLHSLNHRSAWLSFPWQTQADFSKSVKLFKKLGVNIKFFRPPWGKFNILTQYNADKHNLKTILWSLSAKDWSRFVTSNDIKNSIVDNIKAGDIIVLHDSNGAEGAPLRTIDALNEAIPKLKEMGYNFVIVDKILEGVDYEERC